MRAPQHRMDWLNVLVILLLFPFFQVTAGDPEEPELSEIYDCNPDQMTMLPLGNSSGPNTGAPGDGDATLVIEAGKDYVTAADAALIEDTLNSPAPPSSCG